MSKVIYKAIGNISSLWLPRMYYITNRYSEKKNKTFFMFCVGFSWNRMLLNRQVCEGRTLFFNSGIIYTRAKNKFQDDNMNIYVRLKWNVYELKTKLDITIGFVFKIILIKTKSNVVIWVPLLLFWHLSCLWYQWSKTLHNCWKNYNKIRN